MGTGASSQLMPLHIRAAGGIAAAASSLSVDVAERTPLCADAEPVALRMRVAQVAPQVSRMASRFSQLAALGAADCQSGLAAVLTPETRIYLATGLGDVAHTDALYYCVMPPKGEMPQPARFATSGNNMAAFFVAQTAGLTSRNLTVSQAELSLERALELAMSDFAAGDTRSALLGGVDETTLPREFYTRRFFVPPEQPIGEGSGWLVLDAACERNGERALGAILDARVLSPAAAGDHGAGMARVLHACSAFAKNDRRAPSLTLLPGTGLAADDSLALKRELQGHWHRCECEDYLRWSGRFPTAAALGLVSAFVRRSAEPRAYLHVNRDGAGRIGVIAFDVYPRVR